MMNNDLEFKQNKESIHKYFRYIAFRESQREDNSETAGKILKSAENRLFLQFEFV